MSDPPTRAAFQIRLRSLLLLPVVVAVYAVYLRSFPDDYFQWLPDAPFIAAVDLVHYAMLVVAGLILWSLITRRLTAIEAGHLLVLREAALFVVAWVDHEGPPVYEGSTALVHARLLTGCLLFGYVILDHRLRSGAVWWPMLVCLIAILDLLRFFHDQVALPRDLDLAFWRVVQGRELILPPCIEVCESDLRQAFWVWLALLLVVVAAAVDQRGKIRRDKLHSAGASLFATGWSAYLLWRGVIAVQWGRPDYLWL